MRDAVGVDSHKSFHSLRHYFGKTMVTITGNIYQVSGLMGHSSVKVTEDNYVKGFDRKSTLRDFPSLRAYLIDDKNDGKVGEYPPKGIPQQEQYSNWLEEKRHKDHNTGGQGVGGSNPLVPTYKELSPWLWTKSPLRRVFCFLALYYNIIFLLNNIF